MTCTGVGETCKGGETCTGIGETCTGVGETCKGGGETCTGGGETCAVVEDLPSYYVTPPLRCLCAPYFQRSPPNAILTLSSPVLVLKLNLKKKNISLVRGNMLRAPVDRSATYD